MNRRNYMTKKRAMEIIRDYVNNDFEASCDTDYIQDALFAVADEQEIRELGFGWVLDKEEDE